MRRGGWHQLGHQSQKIALELLRNGVGNGAVISPKDLSPDNAIGYAREFRDAGAEVMIDPQFYVSALNPGLIPRYGELQEHRQAASRLATYGEGQVKSLAGALAKLNRQLGSAAIIAPGFALQADQPDIERANRQLFIAAKSAADDLSVPVYATVALGGSVTSSSRTIENAVSAATSMDADGWYFSFESSETRIPRNMESILRFCKAGLALACQGKPVFHAFAGPMCLLSPCIAATAAGIGAHQNLWQLDTARWRSSPSTSVIAV